MSGMGIVKTALAILVTALAFAFGQKIARQS